MVGIKRETQLSPYGIHLIVAEQNHVTPSMDSTNS